MAFEQLMAESMRKQDKKKDKEKEKDKPSPHDKSETAEGSHHHFPHFSSGKDQHPADNKEFH